MQDEGRKLLARAFKLSRTAIANRLGERLTDVTFWRNELNTELESLIAEAAQLTDTKRNVQKAIQDLEAPLHITQECLYHRENRKGIDLVHGNDLCAFTRSFCQQLFASRSRGKESAGGSRQLEILPREAQQLLAESQQAAFGSPISSVCT